MKIFETIKNLNDFLIKIGIQENKRCDFLIDCLNLPIEKILNLYNIKDENLNSLLNYIEILKERGFDSLGYFFLNYSKQNKNQVFTPNHIADFMCEVLEINSNDRVLDPCCGSGTLLVNALKYNCNVLGIEYSHDAFKIAQTNIKIHGNSNSKVIEGDCLNKLSEIENFNVNKVLMNPPYNAQKYTLPKEFTDTWKNTKEDPTKGLYFVYEIAKVIKKGKLAVLLPMQCAIGTSKEIKKYKELMLQEHHLDAVFSLPNDLFYPNASVNVCLMIFDLGVKSEKHTFFGYYKDDGFVKKKNLGRVDANNKWQDIKTECVSLYKERKEKQGKSIFKQITYKDEWLCEAYMETDYSTLTQNDFKKSINDFISYKKIKLETKNIKSKGFDVSKWETFSLTDFFEIKGSKTSKLSYLEKIGKGIYPYVTTKSKNCGVRGFYNWYTEEKNVLTIDSAVIGYCSYREECFSASDHVEILSPKSNLPLNKYIAMFLVTILNMEQYRYSYGRKASQKQLKRTKIRLPITSVGKPDWQFIEEYIKSLPYGDCL